MHIPDDDILFSAMNDNKKHFCTIKLIRYTSMAVIAAEVLFIIYMNLFKCASYPEMDMAKLYRHAIEMVNNRSVIITGWNYITTMELDCSLVFALPLYALTGSIYLSFGIANIIFLAIFLFVIRDILKKLDVDPLFGYIPVILFLIPYRMGMLEYFNMLFYNGGQYTVKVLTPLIVIDLLLEDDKALFSRGHVKNLVLLIAMIFFMTITSMSSGTYVLMSGLVPIILAYFLNIILGKETGSREGLHYSIFRSRKICVLLAALVSFAAGYSLCRILHVSPNSEGMDLVTPHDLIDNIKVTIWGFFCVFVNPDAEAVTSLDGIMQLVRYVFAFLVIGLIIYNLRKLFKPGEEADKQRLLSFPFIITFFILSMTYCCFSDAYYPERYFFIGLIPLFLTIPGFLRDLSDAFRTRYPDRGLLLPVVYALLAAVILCLIPISLYNVRLNVRRGYEGGYANVRSVLDHAAGNGIDSILWLYDLPDGEVARLFDTDIRSGVINFSEDDTPFIDPPRDFYYAAGEASYYSDSHILADKGGANFNRLPDEIKTAYTAIGNIGGYELYTSGSVPFK